jgi:phage tail sheath protein FI
VIKTFRENIGNNTLDFRIAYYPWVHTTVIEATEINYLNFSDLDALKTLLKEEATLSLPGEDEAVVSKRTDIEAEIDKMDAFEDDPDAARKINTAHQIIRGVSGVYKDLMKEIREQRNLLPAAPAMAGVYTMVDNSRGVWKAPANVGLNSVIAPSVSITNEEQEDLNVTLTGKSVNAIRSFVGEGVKVWGARTLDGNSQDWRYINVRRTLIFIEQSVKAAAKAYVFEPNDSNTWLLLKGMLNNFLINLWKQGALAGSSPGEAYNVQVGLGATMTPVDILDGIMRINVKVAITRPAEFIVITFQQKMQES